MPSVTRRTSTGRLRREAVEQRVFDAVERLLDEGESFTSLGVQRIADEAQIARSTFYVHFPDKSALLMRLTESATRDMFPRPEEWVGSADAGGLDVLTRTIARMLGHYRSHAATLAALAEVAAYDAEVAEFWRERVDRFADVLRERLERDRRAGRVPKDLDCDVTARLIAWGAERVVSEHIAGDPSGDGDAHLAASLARAMWAAMHASG
jgi:TetR/AcrR family transcriptional regulator, ethionamide resistance regulator